MSSAVGHRLPSVHGKLSLERNDLGPYLVSNAVAAKSRDGVGSPNIPADGQHDPGLAKQCNHHMAFPCSQTDGPDLPQSVVLLNASLIPPLFNNARQVYKFSLLGCIAVKTVQARKHSMHDNTFLQFVKSRDEITAPIMMDCPEFECAKSSSHLHQPRMLGK